MRRRVGVAALTVVCAVLVPAVPVAAETTAKVDGDNVTITVPIDCVGCKGKKARDGSDLAKYWKKTAQDAWNAAFDKHPYCSKYKFKLNIDIKARGDDFQFTKGRHRILVGEPGSGLAQTGWNGVYETTPAGDPGQRSPDGTRYFENDADGSMGADATPTVIIHEFGHVIGLGDDRDDNGNVVPGRDRTVMAGGSTNSDGTKNTENSRLKFDQQLIDRIGDQLANLGKITCGQRWKGTYDAAATQTAGVCAGTRQFHATVEFGVRRGEIHGTVHQVYKSGDTCYGNTATFSITGTMSRDALTIVVPDGEYLTASSPIPKTSPTRAAVTVQYTLGVVSWVTNWELKCAKDCG